MDDYAIESLRRANEAIDSGGFEKEIVPVTVVSRKGEVTVDIDEQPGKGNPDEDPAAEARLRQGRARSPPRPHRRSATAPPRWC